MSWRAEVGEKGARAWLWRDDVRICSVPSPLIDMLVGELNKTNAAPQAETPYFDAIQLSEARYYRHSKEPIGILARAILWANGEMP